MTIFAKISFRVLAEEKLINSPTNKFDLLDRVHELEVKLEEWLANEMGTEFPEFDFIVE
jgi:hypothetical protein